MTHDFGASARLAPPAVLSITAFDPSCCTGLGAEIKTAAVLGCHLLSGVTACDLRGSGGELRPLPVAELRRSLEAMAAEFKPQAVHVGELATAEIAAAVAEFLESLHGVAVVLGPLRGGELREADAARQRLLRLASVATLNAEAAASVAGAEAAGDTRHRAAEKILELGAAAVVVTGGSLDPADDLLLMRGQDGALYEETFPAEKIVCDGVLGAGCSFAVALACGLTKGSEMTAAVFDAKFYTGEALRHAVAREHGRSSLNHLWKLYR